MVAELVTAGRNGGLDQKCRVAWLIQGVAAGSHANRDAIGEAGEAIPEEYKCAFTQLMQVESNGW